MCSSVLSYLRLNYLKQSLNKLRRHFHSNKSCRKSYEAEGKTTLNILNNEQDLGLMISGFSQVGFRLNNNISILGPMAIFPRSVLSWTVENSNDINEDSLSLFTILEPKLDILVVGIGDKQNNTEYQKRLLPIMRKYKLNFEILHTEAACATFNFLNSEGRNVAGALIPPDIVELHDDDLLKSKLRYQNLYETEWNST